MQNIRYIDSPRVPSIITDYGVNNFLGGLELLPGLFERGKLIGQIALIFGMVLWILCKLVDALFVPFRGVGIDQGVCFSQG